MSAYKKGYRLTHDPFVIGGILWVALGLLFYLLTGVYLVTTIMAGLGISIAGFETLRVSRLP